MRKKPKALIIGAGAVGRGLLAPKLIDAGFMVSFLDVDKNIITRLQIMKYYPLIGRGIFKWIGPVYANTYNQEFLLDIMGFDYIFVSVKSDNLPIVAKTVDKIILSSVAKKPVIYIIENLNNAANKFSKMLNSNVTVLDGIANVVVPLSPHQEVDPTFTVYDPNMELVLKRASGYPIISTAKYVGDDEFELEWKMKFFLHCSVHAFVGWWGRLNNFEYVHEVITSSPHDKVIMNFMMLIQSALLAHYKEYKIIQDRLQNEFKAMSDHLLMDDCLRVSRDSLRKLDPDERYIGLMMFLRLVFGEDVINNTSYQWLAKVTLLAIEDAGFTVDTFWKEIDSWKELSHEELDQYEGILKDLRYEKNKEYC